MLAFSGLNTSDIDAISVIYDVKKEKINKNQIVKSRVRDKSRVEIVPLVPHDFIRSTKTKPSQNKLPW